MDHADEVVRRHALRLYQGSWTQTFNVSHWHPSDLVKIPLHIDAPLPLGEACCATTLCTSPWPVKVNRHKDRCDVVTHVPLPSFYIKVNAYTSFSINGLRVCSSPFFLGPRFRE